MTTLGQLLLGVSLFGSLISIGLLIFGNMAGPKDGEKFTNAGYIGTLMAFLFTTLATLLLLVALLSKNFSFLYVVENHSRDVSNLGWLYGVSALWAGREGSLLFWAWLLSAFTAFMTWRRMSVTDAVSNMGIAVLNFVQIFFIVALFFDTNNPFKATPAEALQAGKLVGDYALMGMNPLLQHWAMILHPPTLFIGYAGLTVPFAFALGALIAKDSSKSWVEIVDRVTVFSWLSLGIGIGLGAIWAYVVLGWGGYWAWDPVENASLLPWLTGVGLLHSFTVYRRRGAFKKWAVMMTSVTFVLVLLGTFITRSGVIQSVHAFGEDALSLWWFLGMMIVSLVVPALLLVSRSDLFKGKDDFTSLLSKEGSYYFNNLLMLFAALLVAFLTLSPAFKGPTFSAASFDLLARPIGIFYVLLMTVCPILSWGSTGAEAFWKRAKWPLAGGGVLAAGLLGIWATAMLPNYTPNGKGLGSLLAIQAPIDHIESVIGLIVAGFAIALPIYLFIDGARKRAAARGEKAFAAFGHILFKSRTQSGGYLTHLGIGIVLIGLIGSSMYVKDVQFTLPNEKGAKQAVGEYELVFQGTTSKTLSNGDVEQTVAVDLMKGGVLVDQLKPMVTQMVNRAQNQSSRLNASVHSELLRDVFIAFQSGDTSGLTFDVKINPMISWAWAGFLLTVFGAAIAAWPRKETPLAVVPAPKPSKQSKTGKKK
jgi:cytochrome c-type biogenesis protein CcmF